jgi:hypothetical protein
MDVRDREKKRKNILDLMMNGSHVNLRVRM